MGKICGVATCLQSRATGKSLFSIPNDNRSTVWLKHLQLESADTKKQILICEDHFYQKDLIVRGTSKILKKLVFPISDSAICSCSENDMDRSCALMLKSIIPSSTMSKTISTHILDTSIGKAAANVPVTLYKFAGEKWTKIQQSSTNTDGRASELISMENYTSGTYKLHFKTEQYFKNLGVPSFFPFVEIVFNCEQNQHYHIPLLLNPFGYTTYRGT